MIEYQYASNKGQTKQGDLISNPFGFGDVDVEFTGDRVTETAAEAGEIAPAWSPVLKGFFRVITVDGEEVEFDPRKKYTAEELATLARKDVKIIAEDGTIKFDDLSDEGKVTVAEKDRLVYVYDNVVIPQNDLPTIKAEMKSIALVAHARRIAIKVCGIKIN